MINCWRYWCCNTHADTDTHPKMTDTHHTDTGIHPDTQRHIYDRHADTWQSHAETDTPIDLPLPFLTRSCGEEFRALHGPAVARHESHCCVLNHQQSKSTILDQVIWRHIERYRDWLCFRLDKWQWRYKLNWSKTVLAVSFYARTRTHARRRHDDMHHSLPA